MFLVGGFVFVNTVYRYVVQGNVPQVPITCKLEYLLGINYVLTADINNSDWLLIYQQLGYLFF